MIQKFPIDSKNNISVSQNFNNCFLSGETILKILKTSQNFAKIYKNSQKIKKKSQKFADLQKYTEILKNTQNNSQILGPVSPSVLIAKSTQAHPWIL